MQKAFVRRFAATQATSVVGRAIPFGIGAVIGGVGNNMLGRRVITSSRTAFGPAPSEFPAGLEPRIRVPGSPTVASRVSDAGRTVGGSAHAAGRAIGSGVASASRSIGSRAQRALPSRWISDEQGIDDYPVEENDPAL